MVTVHAINCGWMRPLGGALWERESRGVGPARLACRCLVVEGGADGPILVDTGFGPADFTVPDRLAMSMRLMDRPALPPGSSALARLRLLGIEPEAVRHVVMTHLDFDHAGGLTDFPWATVHVTAAEARAARARDGLKARLRWRPAQWPAAFAEHEAPADDVLGLPSLGGLPGGLRFLPLPGHSPGHAGVAIPLEDQWVVHVGDAVFDLAELEGPGRARPLALAYELAMQVDPAQRLASAETVRRLAGRAALVCTHDPRLPRHALIRAEGRFND